MLYRYPYNNALHHHVESIINSCLESGNNILVDHLFEECNFLGKILQTDQQPTVSGDGSQVDLREVTDFLFFEVFRLQVYVLFFFYSYPKFPMEYEYIQQ